MFRKSLRPIIFATLVLSLGFPLRRASADIITDIDQLEPEKKPEEKKKKEIPASQTLKKPSKGKIKDAAKDKEAAAENAVPPDLDPGAQTMPNRADMIPEPSDDDIGPPKAVANPLALKSKGKGKSKEQRVKAPVHYKSDGDAVYSRDRSTVVMRKNVTITQDDMRLQSDDAKVTFLPKAASASSPGGGVKNAVLDGKVAIARYSSDPSERMNAKSDKAIFDNLLQIVTLEGNARLWRDGNLIKGDRIVYDMASGEIKVDKAQGVVQPDRMKK